MAENPKSNEDIQYFQKLKCNGDFQHGKSCECKGSGIIAGADITSTIKPILDWFETRIDYMKSIKPHKEELVTLKTSIGLLKEAKQIIEENVIKVE